MVTVRERFYRTRLLNGIEPNSAIGFAMSAVDPTEARFHADDPPGIVLPPATILVAALVLSMALWAGAWRLAQMILG